MRQVSLRLPAESLERLDRRAREAGATRSVLLRRLVDGELPAGPRRAADREEALGLLAESARRGSVPAQVALARELREEAAGDVSAGPAAAAWDELERVRRRRGTACPVGGAGRAVA